MTILEFIQQHIFKTVDEVTVIRMYTGQEKTLEEWSSLLEKDFNFLPKSLEVSNNKKKNKNNGNS